MTLYHSAQPESLPPSLPPGTRYQGVLTNGCFPNGAHLVDGRYLGHIRRDDGTDDPGSVSPQQILWRKVPVVGGEAALELQVGETWETNTCALPRQMTVSRIGNNPGYLYIYVQDDGVTAEYARSQLIRRLSAPTQSVPEPDTILGPWRAGPPVAEPEHVIRGVTDPYALHRFTNDDASVAAKMAERDARAAKRRRFTANNLRDLDRPLLKLGGRFGKVVTNTHPRGWPEGSDHE
jgi:hypothetical protein